MTEFTKGRVIRTEPASRNVFYARKGEMVFCENGHEIGRIARDMPHGEEMVGDEIEGFKPLAYGQAFPPCQWCGGYYTVQDWGTLWSGGFLFKCDETGEIVGRV